MQKTNFKRIFKIILLPALAGLVLFVGGYYFVLYTIWDQDPYFLQADKCLDYGGVWERESAHCWYAGECEDKGGFWSAAESRCNFNK